MDNRIKSVLESGIQTRRLTLRPINTHDENDMFEYSSDQEVCKYLRWGPYESIDSVREFIANALNEYENPHTILWGIENKNKTKLIGVIRVYNITETSASVSYILNYAFSGCGFATEALESVIDVCFAKLKLTDIYAYFIEPNQKSRHVMERAGMSMSKNKPQEVNIKGTTYTLYEYVASAEAEL